MRPGQPAPARAAARPARPRLGLQRRRTEAWPGARSDDGPKMGRGERRAAEVGDGGGPPDGGSRRRALIPANTAREVVARQGGWQVSAHAQRHVHAMKVMVIERLHAGRTSALGDMMGEGSVSEKYAPASFRCMAGTSYGVGANARGCARPTTCRRGGLRSQTQEVLKVLDRTSARAAGIGATEWGSASCVGAALENRGSPAGSKELLAPGRFLPAIGASVFLGPDP